MNRRLDCDICGCFGDNIAVYPGLWIVPLVRGTSEAEGVFPVKIVPPPPLRGEWPSALLYADKPAVVATDAIIPRRPPNLGGEFNRLGQQLYYYLSFSLPLSSC